MVKILVECPSLIATVRVGVLESLKLFQEEQKAEVRFCRTVQIKAEDLVWCDVLICVRGCDMLTLQLVQQAKRNGRFIVYYLDDDLLNLPPSSASAPYYQDKSVRDSMKELLSLSNVLWCINPNIAKKYSQYGSMRVVLTDMPSVPPPLMERTTHNSCVKVLYAGSTDHEKIVQIYLTPVVKRLAKEYGEDVEFTFIGANPHISSLSNVHYHKFFLDYDAYREFVQLGHFDIGIAIIEDTSFYSSKYYNKFVEYTSIGAVGVYTCIAPYTLIVQDGKNGFLFQNSEESIYRTLSHAIDHPEERAACITAAAEGIVKRFSYEAVSAALENELPELIFHQAPKLSVHDIHLVNRHCLRFRTKAVYYYHKFGLFAVFVVMYKCVKIGIQEIVGRTVKFVKGIF